MWQCKLIGIDVGSTLFDVGLSPLRDKKSTVWFYYESERSESHNHDQAMFMKQVVPRSGTKQTNVPSMQMFESYTNTETKPVLQLKSDLQHAPRKEKAMQPHRANSLGFTANVSKIKVDFKNGLPTASSFLPTPMTSSSKRFPIIPSSYVQETNTNVKKTMPLIPQLGQTRGKLATLEPKIYLLTNITADGKVFCRYLPLTFRKTRLHLNKNFDNYFS